jgi:hypothetical protein
MTPLLQFHLILLGHLFTSHIFFTREIGHSNEVKDPRYVH